ncbi:hypothetical protein VIGAN_10227400 [Vigna angularis var. angularis]|uniref:Leucine-rich repeat-containing N-terminal plant-type domain-containing protein n=1 Tax=Vigna angularis var. angularis TaxID=157739 RepID=A0A0S3T5Z1_PHAAN|nr:hypothetical protein VIGAN_10227400 [Vigna angularis var. angularis]
MTKQGQLQIPHPLGLRQFKDLCMLDIGSNKFSHHAPFFSRIVQTSSQFKLLEVGRIMLKVRYLHRINQGLF